MPPPAAATPPASALSGETLTHLATQVGLAVAAGADPNTAMAQLNIYPTLADVRTAQVAVNAGSIIVLSYATPGDCAPQTYARGGTDGYPGTITDAAGGVWSPVADIAGIDTVRYGVVGGARWKSPQLTLVGSPVDDHRALQGAADATLYLGVSAVVQGARRSFVSDTIRLGYGGSFVTFEFKGRHADFFPSGNLLGAAIGATFTDRPVINIQGGRGGVFSDWFLMGAVGATLVARNVCTPKATVDDTNPANWGAGEARYTPAAGITVDGYSGPQPSPAYPEPSTYPPYARTRGSYKKAFSSGVELRNLNIYGFNTGVAYSPANASGNGDYCTAIKGQTAWTKWCFSWGQTQSRNMEVRDWQVAYCYCAFTTAIHGQQSGEIGSEFVNISAGGLIKIWHGVPGGLSGELILTSFYAEALYKLGDSPIGGVGSYGIVLNGPVIGHDLQTLARGISAAMLDCSQPQASKPGQSVGPLSVTINGGGLDAYPAVYPIMTTGLLMNGVAMTPLLSGAKITHAYQSFAMNATCGGLVTPTWFAAGVSHIITYPLNDVDAVAEFGPVTARYDFAWGQRNYCIPLYVSRVYPRLAGPEDGVDTPQIGRVTLAVRIAAGSTMNTATGLVAYADARRQDQLETYGGAPGDIALERDSNTVVFIKSATYSGGVAIAQTGVAQNNVYSGAALPYECNAWPTSPNLDILNTRLYTPANVVMATTNAGTGVLTITNALAGTANEQIAVGDRIWFTANDNPLALTIATNKVTAINLAGGTITLGGYSGPTTAITARLKLMVHAPPANV